MPIEFAIDLVRANKRLRPSVAVGRVKKKIENLLEFVFLRVFENSVFFFFYVLPGVGQ